MNSIATITICIVPSLLVLWYIYIKDTIEKEPKYLLALLFIGGIISCTISLWIFLLFKHSIPFLNLSYKLMTIPQIIFKLLIVVALVEESSKWIINYIIVWKNKNFNFLYDSIVYCVFTSIGFATMENLIYAFSKLQSLSLEIIIRSIICIPVHAIFGVIMGYLLGLSKKENNKKYKILSLLLPIILHFIYDLLLVKMNTITILLLSIYLIVSFISVYYIIKETHEK